MEQSGGIIRSAAEANRLAISCVAEQKKHASHLWRTRNSAEMVPDSGFVRQLKMLCETLEVVWDAVSHVWEIWDFPTDGKEAYLVMRVQTAGKDYRELGTDVLLKMQQNLFFSNNLTPKQVCDYLDEMDTQLVRRKEQDFRNRINAKARDTFLWLMGTPMISVPRSYKIERVINESAN